MDGLERSSTRQVEVSKFDDGMVSTWEQIWIMAERGHGRANRGCLRRRQLEKRPPKVHAYRRRRRDKSAHFQTATRQLLPEGPARPLLESGPRRDRHRVGDGGIRYLSEKIGKVTSTLGIGRMSASRVSRIIESLDDIEAGLQRRDLSNIPLPTFGSMPPISNAATAGTYPPCTLVTAIGAGTDGHGCLLDLDAIDTESFIGFCAFCANRISNVPCAASDARGRLEAAP